MRTHTNPSNVKSATPRGPQSIAPNTYRLKPTRHAVPRTPWTPASTFMVDPTLILLRASLQDPAGRRRRMSLGIAMMSQSDTSDESEFHKIISKTFNFQRHVDLSLVTGKSTKAETQAQVIDEEQIVPLVQHAGISRGIRHADFVRFPAADVGLVQIVWGENQPSVTLVCHLRRCLLDPDYHKRIGSDRSGWRGEAWMTADEIDAAHHLIERTYR